ncbi:MAG: NgoFVII family restriction endonuclease [Candidatus Hydrogenedentes bacterium]|nr:NgoFVII family restriction endonuclease [Candidatus Hydrogenedentota bacterium]
MPRIFDNIEQHLLPALRQTLDVSERADFCVGYFNLRGWKRLHDSIEQFTGAPDGQCCRLLVGMQRLPQDQLREAMSLSGDHHDDIDNQTAAALRKQLAQEFRDQLTIGAPTNEDEEALRRLAAQIRGKKVVVKLFLRHALHAKLYLLFRPDPINPTVGFLGSSNLTMAGLTGQGELNVDVMDHDACSKLAAWFEARWNDRYCIDISDDLVAIIDESWARETPVPPYHIYLKIAYHLSREARAGISEFRIPKDFGNRLFDYQTAAVKIAAHHLHKRGGVVIGDVVGLGKTLMATALARIFEDDYDLETLIICPKNLVPMWEDYKDEYRLRGKVLSISQVKQKLPDLRRYRLLILDESHNLRNREGRRFRIIQEYIRANDSKCILLTATPYNKTYLDLSSQLRLFIEEDRDLGVRPEALLRQIPETEFIRRHQCGVKTLAAFEKSEHPDDWRDLMRLFLVRRTRSFIKENYTQLDPENGRRYLTYENGERAYFPDRKPRTVPFQLDEKSKTDQYAKLYSPKVVGTINNLFLPRYGLGNYEKPTPESPPTQADAHMLQDLSRAGKRLMGFCRTNLFKRLESSGAAFLQSVERHILRNYVFLHAIENDLPLPLGTQSAEMLDSAMTDTDADGVTGDLFADDGTGDNGDSKESEAPVVRSEAAFQRLAADVYDQYAGPYKKRFKWLHSSLFTEDLGKHLRADAVALTDLLNMAGDWDPARDAKLQALIHLLAEEHPNEKVLVFTQFADTVRYLEAQVRNRGIQSVAGVTSDTDDPTGLAWRFSPVSNQKRDRVPPEKELRALIATDILSEGQNLQDCAIVVNFDLPWAIIRLIQRAGRVDRIGQQAENILCYSFLPADGVEKIIHLRSRVKQRLNDNAEVVGTDEAFFEGDDAQQIQDLYHEKAGILDGTDDLEVDLASLAFQIWKNATEKNPELERAVTALPDVVYSTRAHAPTLSRPEGVLVYARTAEDNDALAYVGADGQSITESQYEILTLAACKPDTPALPRDEKHHDLVRDAVEHIAAEEKSVGGQLGRPSGARFRVYERLKRHAEHVKSTLFDIPELHRAIQDIYRFPLRQAAIDTLNRQLRLGVDDQHLAELVITLREEARLCIVEEEAESREPRLICSMGLFPG